MGEEASRLTVGVEEDADLSAHLGAGLSYVFDKYTVNDFALGPQANGLIPSPPAATPSILMVGYYFLPYTANTFAARVSYFW